MPPFFVDRIAVQSKEDNYYQWTTSEIIICKVLHKTVWGLKVERVKRIKKDKQFTRKFCGVDFRTKQKKKWEKSAK